MILVIADTHCYYDIVNRQIEHAESTMGVTIDCVLHLGDFGMYREHLHAYFVKRQGRFLRPLYFIEGNHEDFREFDSLLARYNGTFFTHLPRASVQAVGPYRMLCLGGSAYMDAFNTQPGSEIKDHHIDSCLALPPDQVDIIISHDCPAASACPTRRAWNISVRPDFRAAANCWSISSRACGCSGIITNGSARRMTPQRFRACPAAGRATVCLMISIRSLRLKTACPGRARGLSTGCLPSCASFAPVVRAPELRRVFYNHRPCFTQYLKRSAMHHRYGRNSRQRPLRILIARGRLVTSSRLRSLACCCFLSKTALSVAASSVL